MSTMEDWIKSTLEGWTQSPWRTGLCLPWRVGACLPWRARGSLDRGLFRDWVGTVVNGPAWVSPHFWS